MAHAHRWWHLEDLDVDTLAGVLADLDVDRPEQRAAQALADARPVNIARARGYRPQMFDPADLPGPLPADLAH